MTPHTIAHDWIHRRRPVILVSAIPVALVFLALFGPFLGPLYSHSGAGIGLGGSVLRGSATIDPNIAITSFALGYRAALEMISGHLPLWNHFSGLGAPLLGEMQSAAMFPPTLLLLLPNGQAIEHAFLQWVAGIGAYLFFRRFGLGATAAVVGAVLYELNGVFATLRNAAFNPVAFLPWLLYGVEVLRAHVESDDRYGTRLPFICVTALAAAFAIYAGFPETTYLYSFFIVGWALFRMRGLTRGQAASLFSDLSAAAVLALALSAPLIVSFVSFLREANVGGHGEYFAGMTQEKETAILHFLPYLYGLFLASPDPRVAGLSISSGGYAAFAPAVLAAAALFVPGHRAVKLFLAAWIVIALGASYGWPVIHAAFTALPLLKLAVISRYLNASWLFALIFLAALAIEGVPQLSPTQRRKAAALGLMVIAAALTAAIFSAREILGRAWTSVPTSVLLSLITGTAAVTAAAAAVCTSSARLRKFALGAVVAEAAALFFLPFRAQVRKGDIDYDLIAFLRNNAAYQRVIKTDGYGLNANFGAAFGIPLLHYDDLPVPQRTIDFLRRRIDEYAGAIFLPEHPPLSPEELIKRKALVQERYAAYANAGVKYIMAAPDFNAERAAPIVYRDEHPILLTQDDTLEIEGIRQAADTPLTAEAITLRISTFNDTTTGDLQVRLCADGACSDGAADIKTGHDGQLIVVPLTAPLTLAPRAQFSLRLRKTGPTTLVVWTYPGEAGNTPRYVTAPGTTKDNYTFDFSFLPQGKPKPVYMAKAMVLFELQGVRPYADAPACRVTMRSHDEMDTDCRQASQLTRLNVHMDGWHASVDGVDTPIELVDDTFQKIAVPQGKARIAFRYAPSGFAAALAAAIAALALIAAVFVSQIVRGRQNCADGASTPA